MSPYAHAGHYFNLVLSVETTLFFLPNTILIMPISINAVTNLENIIRVWCQGHGPWWRLVGVGAVASCEGRFWRSGQHVLGYCRSLSEIPRRLRGWKPWMERDRDELRWFVQFEPVWGRIFSLSLFVHFTQCFRKFYVLRHFPQDVFVYCVVSSNHKYLIFSSQVRHLFF